MANFKLLELPRTFACLSRMDKFLWGSPFGIDQKTFASLRIIQSKRSLLINDFWPKSSEISNAKKVLDRILMNYFEWPSELFHPDDRCDAVFFYPFGDLSDAEGFMEIERNFNSFIAMNDEFREKSYLQFLQCLIE